MTRTPVAGPAQEHGAVLVEPVAAGDTQRARADVLAGDLQALLAERAVRPLVDGARLDVAGRGVVALRDREHPRRHDARHRERQQREQPPHA